ncbi:hypothetical protein ACF0H5_009593 [Mactra antiquata]
MHLESFEVLIIFLFIPCIGFAKKVRVKYSKYGSDIDFECAAKGVQEMSIGVKYTTTGCEVIPYTWPTSPPDGSTTLVKSFTEVTFPTQITMEGDGVAFRSLPNVGPPDTVRTLVIEAPDEESLPRLIKVIYQAS